MTTSIIVNPAGRDITVQPTRVGFKVNSGTKSLRWIPVGNGAAIDDIRFDSGSAPIENLTPQANGEWTANWATDNQPEEIWKYSVTVSIGSTQLPVLDPEIENGPPGGFEGDDG